MTQYQFSICSKFHITFRNIYMMALIPTERFYKSSWIEYHHNHCFMTKDLKPNTLLPGDFIVSRYPKVWNEYLAQINTLNLGIGEDRVANILWWTIDLSLASSTKNIVILCRTNNIPIETPRDIANCISIGSIFWKKSNGINVSVCGLIPRDECFPANRLMKS